MILLAVMVLLLAVSLAAAELSSQRVPDGLGVNIHFTGEPARDLDMIQAAGFRFIRMDFHWSSIERERGVYDFAEYDRLTDALERRGVRALYILDYGNPLYETDQSVRTEAGRQAFARWAATAAERYRGRGILWELWNEPNIGFWKPQPSVDDYMALAHAVFPAIRRADAGALLVAPATSGIPLDFLEECFKRGLLQLVDAVTVHPYRRDPPETVEGDYLRLRALIARYRPERPQLPILSGEWGYSSVWRDYDDELQGKYLPRQFLTNLAHGVGLSIWYDWHDDGQDPQEPEHHFGTVTFDHEPKPAYLAMQRLTAALSGMTCVKRLESAPQDWLLLFSNGQRRAVAAWTMADPREVEIAGRRVALDGSPQYVEVPAAQRALVAEGAWTVRQRSVGVRGGASAGEALAPELEVRVKNPFPEAVQVRLATRAARGLRGRFAGPHEFALGPGEEQTLVWRGRTARRDEGELAVTVLADIGGFRSRQRVPLVIINPLSLHARRERDGRLALGLRSPGLQPFEGTLEARVGQGPPLELRVQIGPGARVTGGADHAQVALEGDTAWFVLPIAPPPQETVRVVAHDGAQALTAAVLRIEPLAVTTATAHAVGDGDPNVSARFELADAAAGLRLAYDYGEGWKFVRIAPRQELTVEGKPHLIGVWVRGDGSGCRLNMRYIDTNGHTYQPTYGRADFEGWRFITAVVDDAGVYGWGGTHDPEEIGYPIRLDTFILVDGPRSPVAGEMDFAGFQFIHRDR